MTYYIARTVSRPFDEVLAQTVARLQAAGFGVLCDIDVQATLKAKIGADLARYRILGACNPRFAYEALKLEEKIGLLMPCNVIVRETADGRVEVASIDPLASLERTGNAALARPALEVRRSLTGVIEGIEET